MVKKKGDTSSPSSSPVRGPGGSSFDVCPKCKKSMAAALISSHGCGILPDPPKKKPDEEGTEAPEVPAKSTKSKGEGKATKKRPKKTKDDDDESDPPKKKKKTKDENKIKRPLSSYMIYVNQKRPEFKEKHPDAKLGELTKIIAAAWKLLTPDQKKEFEDIAAKDKQRYADEKAAKGIEPKKPAKKRTSKPKKKDDEDIEVDDEDAKEDEE